MISILQSGPGLDGAKVFCTSRWDAHRNLLGFSSFQENVPISCTFATRGGSGKKIPLVFIVMDVDIFDFVEPRRN